MTGLLDISRADDVARGLSRLFHRRSLTVLCEVPLPNGRRADMVAIDGRGQISIVEIKVSRADLLADSKWPDYLDWCDRFYWALSPALDPGLIAGPAWQPQRCGLIIADRYDATVLREAAACALAPARRRSELLRIGRLAMRRLMVSLDPDLAVHAGEQDIGL
ncbi:MmcB family DNA repair protein [Sphingomonas lacunae]|uniref:MmcB family DNA repair protein n=1 Tax=Sphingomonas lacunae TaxID=2698828 RepID=A0A6M4AS29_9SPHN|nr:MmcB family DNA repair protein [Sphingomonas lacunae]QJQ31874.1 MmcB family DNA repair protein [Sphingomonas lacunae]